MARNRNLVISAFILTSILLSNCTKSEAGVDNLAQATMSEMSGSLMTEQSPSETQETVDPFSIPQGEWIFLASMQISRSEYSVVAIDGQIYAPGGLGGGSTTDSSNALERYDPATNTWEHLAILPDARDHMMTAVWNGMLYLFGGGSLSGRGPNAWVYDPVTDQWQTISNIPFQLSAGAATTLGDYIYLIGGLGDPFADEGFAGEVLRYDPQADEWLVLAAMPVVVNHCAVVVLDGEIYVLGGRSSARDYNLVQIYNPESDQWRDGVPFQQARAGHAAVAVNNMIYVMGGERINSEDYSVLSSVEIFDPSTQIWSFGEPLPVALHGVPAVEINGTIFVVGGSELVAGVDNHGYLLALKP